MDGKLLDFILEIHENPNSYTKHEILLELYDMYPKWRELKEQILHDEGICPNCGGDLLTVRDNNISETDYPFVVLMCPCCQSKF